MSPKKLRSRIAGAGTLAVVAATALLTFTGGSASALTAPAYPAAGVYPNWLTAGNQFTVASVTLTSGSTTVTTTNNFGAPNAVQYGDIIVDSSGTTNIPADDTVTGGTFGTAVANPTTSLTLTNAANATITETVMFEEPDTQSVTNILRSDGSDTTLYMMQQIGDLYTDAGLYGCSLLGTTNVNGTQNGVCQNDEENTGNNLFSDTPTTDTNDNFDRTEVLEGINDIGSGNGQKMLCGGGLLATPQPLDWSRSSKPATQACSSGSLVELGYAKDSAPAVDFQEINPHAVGTSTFYNTFGAFAGDGNPNAVPFPSGGIGAVAAGWEPGDPYNCVPAGEHLEGTACSGTPFNDVDNYQGNASPAFRLWCEADSATATDTTEASGRITDWGELTDLNAASLASAISSGSTITSLSLAVDLDNALSAGSVNLVSPTGSSQTLSASAASSGASSITITGSPTASANFPAGSRIVASSALFNVGHGAPIGVPVRIQGVNTGSGTVATFTGYAGAGQSAGGPPVNECANSSFVSDYNGYEGANPISPTFGTNQLQTYIAVENNASQIGSFAAGDFPNDPADQAVELASVLYFESFGVNLSNPNAGSASLTPGTFTMPAGVPTSYTVTLLNEDGEQDSIPHERSNVYPTARTLFNLYHTTTVRSSLAGFLNWICDSNDAIQKDQDLVSGANYDNEITNIINDNFEYTRLNDDTPELASQNPGIPGSPTDVGDHITGGGPNATCDAALQVTATGSNVVTYTGGNVPSPQAFLTSGPNQAVATAVSGVITAGTGAVTNITGGTITLATGTVVASGTWTLYFENVAPMIGQPTSANT